jgi:hypothetical protein
MGGGLLWVAIVGRCLLWFGESGCVWWHYRREGGGGQGGRCRVRAKWGKKFGSVGGTRHFDRKRGQSSLTADATKGQRWVLNRGRVRGGGRCLMDRQGGEGGGRF